MPAIFQTVMQLALAVVGAAPSIETAVASMKDLIQRLVEGKLITIDEQNQIHLAVDGMAAARRAGVTASAWIVAPDPIAPATVTTTTTVKTSP